jgi:hypothetical protein
MGPYTLGDIDAAIAGDDPVVLWATRAFSELVWLWWLMDAIARVAGGVQGRFFLARPALRDPDEATGAASPKIARAALEVASPLSDEMLRAGVELWKRYTSASPLAFDEARRRGSVAFPELTTSGEAHGRWFPRLADDRLRLAQLDEVLLGAFGDTWLKSHHALAHPLARPFGVFYILTRLKVWAAHGALEHKPKPGARDGLDDEFRLTETGRRLLEDGLERVDAAPRLFVGGCCINDPAAPWVRIDDDVGWRLAAGA